MDAQASEHLKAVANRVARLQALKKELETMMRSCAKRRIIECYRNISIASAKATERPHSPYCGARRGMALCTP
ncbi:hypothetical protein [Hyphomicrobium sp. DY-1]|uniref:hypothetical protein n=1 Tax=Hyphomicrobium sp. DY-1 TaxID=3075650 RepID=UPI0039C1547F